MVPIAYLYVSELWNLDTYKLSPVWAIMNEFVLQSYVMNQDGNHHDKTQPAPTLIKTPLELVNE